MNPIGPFSTSDLPSVYFDGQYRVLACIPSSPESIARFPKFGTAHRAAPLDPSEWREIDLGHYNIPVMDQGMTSSCTGHGTACGMEYCYVQSGRSLVELSPFFVYGLVNHGRDAGAMISDCLTALKTKGVCPRSSLPPGVMFERDFPAEAFTEAKKYMLVEAYHCNTFEEICSAITLGFVVPLGLYVGRNFMNVGSDGVAQLPMQMDGGGHCVLGMGLKKHPQYGWVIKIQNSWGPRFGQDGKAYLRKEHLGTFGMTPDAFAIQYVTDTTDNTDPVVVS